MSSFAYSSSSKHAQYHASPSYPSGSLPYYSSTPYPAGLSQLPSVEWQPATPLMRPVPLPELPEERQLAQYRHLLETHKADPIAYDRVQRDMRHLEGQLAERRRRQREIVASAYDAQMRADAHANRGHVPEKFATPPGELQRHHNTPHRHAIPSPPATPHRPHDPSMRSSRAYHDSPARNAMAMTDGSTYSVSQRR
ncbi:hypothetical protein OBBRIDRAFT_833182 [Obba rivulosa]|uniref:Uncharacterized protein n=1 Tax=Obba rivulosa TaxID=1052685 RepID=A0A8E2AYA2_9APHY|nr:hypothetical protein OBBRIDRAFT_833182 [Obba rivulosa]